MLGAYGRDELNDTTGIVILSTFNGINSRNDRKRIEYILTRQAHQSRVYNVKVHPQPPPPAEVDSDYNIVYAMVRVSVVFHPPDTCERKNKSGLSTGTRIDMTECRERVVARIIFKLPNPPSQPIMDEEGTLLRDKVRIRERRGGSSRPS